MSLYLASASPRRAELLTQIGIRFQRVVADVDEQQQPGESPADYVQRLALQKAQAAANKIKDKQALVLGADTIVLCDGQVMEKPLHQAHAKQMMLQLSDNTHQVLTAISLVKGEQSRVQLVCTDVTFKALTEQEISAYWQSGEPKDKAGGYGIQGIAGQFVTHISGSYSAVVGLPLYQTAELIKSFTES